MRGLLAGMSFGAVVSVGGAAMLSLSAPLPKVVNVTVQTPSETSEPTGESALPTETPGPDADLVEAAPVAPDEAPGVEPSGMQAADTQSASRPVVGAEETSLAETADLQAAQSSTPDVTTQTDTPVIVVDSLPAPSVPLQEADVVVSSEPAQPPQPGIVSPLPEMPPATQAPDVTVVPTIATATGPTADRGADLETGMTKGAAPESPENPESAPVMVPSVEVEIATLQPPASGNMPVGQLPTVVTAPAEQIVPGERQEIGGNFTEAQEETADQQGEQVDALSTTEQGQETSDGPTIGTPVVPLPDRDNETSEVSSDIQGISPFKEFSVPFSNSEDRPLMSIVLIDDEQSIGAEALIGFPYPLSFAIDPQDPKAAEKMEARRAAGFEVLVLTNLPREAAPQDAETALAVWFDTLPETIGVLEGTGTGFQGNRPLADQVSAVVAASGRGMVTQNHGLNTVQKLAARDGVPASVVFRDFDGAGQNPKAIRRFLDQAAFRAGQEGAVIMLGRVRPDTISALLLWGLQDRASRVALAPVSAALSNSIDE
ncbi:hypothetical protein DL239_07375 [Sedimentitalea sp. CY04]|uniref:Divergent polysaccharide deacetylase n=2 Tax=Parasedimentitalea denitrificans TaxID=2211118 RepID=A0ABX0W851_9RHOB|nr:hypothetical protein [Sedimentitalea sp. CY04]